MGALPVNRKRQIILEAAKILINFNTKFNLQGGPSTSSRRASISSLGVSYFWLIVISYDTIRSQSCTLAWTIHGLTLRIGAGYPLRVSRISQAAGDLVYQISSRVSAKRTMASNSHAKPIAEIITTGHACQSNRIKDIRVFLSVPGAQVDLVWLVVIVFTWLYRPHLYHWPQFLNYLDRNFTGPHICCT